MKSYREDGKLVIEISEDALLKGVSQIPDISAYVTDSEEFLNFCEKQICVFGDTGDFNSCSTLTNLIDLLVIEAIESAAGVVCK